MSHLQSDWETPDEDRRRRRRVLMLWSVVGAICLVIATSALVGRTLFADDGVEKTVVATEATATPTMVEPTESASPSQRPKPRPKKTMTPEPATALDLPCAPATGPFTPVKIAMAGATNGATVLALGRDANGVVGVPPITTEGKYEFAWDRPPGVLPGSSAGTAIFNAHTWPDGTALGNAMLNAVQTGEQIKLIDESGLAHCYTISKREELVAEAQVPEVYSTTSEPRLVFIVCSGTRRGPGDWSHRTLWWAVPS